MFKKAFEAKNQQRLSGADKKKLRRTLRDKLPRASDSDFDALLPPKTEVTVAKLQNRVHVYTVEGGFPMFFDVDGRGSEIFPTGGEVSRFIIGGADLMFPGISVPLEGLPSFTAGEPWAIKVPGNPAPIAVGATTMSSTEAIKAGLRGKALRITHHYGDLLWQSAESHFVPNAGFLEDMVFEDPAFSSSSQASESCEAISVAFSDQQNDVEYKMSETASDMSVNPGDKLIPVISKDASKDSDQQLATDIGHLEVTDTVSADGSSAKGLHNANAEDVDTLLDKCLLQALHTTVKDKDLPMPGSTLWSSHVLPCRPSGVTLDIKKSSYKKLSKWLQAKSVAGLITVKEDKYKKEVVLLSVNRNIAEYTMFKPERRLVVKAEQLGDHAAGENKTLEVVEVFKSSVHVNAIFASVGAEKEKLYTASEASDVVFRYIDQENLVKPTDKSIVVLDAILCDALFKGSIKKGSAYPTEVRKKDLGSMFISRMQPHHLVRRGGDLVVRKGALKDIQIMTERRQGNKKVTRLSGLETFMVDPEALASELQKKFACSTTVAELPGKKGYEVLLQGGVIEDLARHLIEQYGIPKKYIEVLDKTKK
ncbi:eukaryotic translation initiation factor 2D isoform X2 [Punica granatum]|uniref:Eukaryotic translation initiation factor 2D isoform X2 n=1 Tax=Punica granatum TaxID=22663 RepID=A0A6P8DK57_PUNGR|nr:eukaryotic translation initiation factor 2D isoform X2 [Punica granatum]